MRPIRAIVAHFTTPRCVYCGTRQDRAEGYCVGRRVVAAWHMFPDGSKSRDYTGGEPGRYDELADAPDWDD